MKAIRVLLLHDFVATKKHPSKIYQQIQIEDELIREACLNHHNQEAEENWLVPIIKKYDQKAAGIIRKHPYGVNTRYDKTKGEIDFQRLAREIEERQHSAQQLYVFIKQSKELARLPEAMDYGKSSLKNHLLVAVNLMIDDFLREKLALKNEQLIIISPSATKDGEKQRTKEKIHPSANDAEMHLPAKKDHSSVKNEKEILVEGSKKEEEWRDKPPRVRTAHYKGGADELERDT